MLILGKDQLKDPSLGYARTFVRQVEDCLGLALESGVKIVANAGGLNPAGLADRLREVAAGLGLDPQVAHVEGDDVRHLSASTGRPHRQRLPRRLRHRRRADRRRRHRRHRPRHRRLARRRPGRRAPRLDARRRTTSWRARSSPATSSSAAPRRPAATSAASSTCPHRDRPLGFPIAEVAADGSSVITKHAGTGGAVTVDTVTAQLVYEIQSTRYLGPDVTVHLDSIRLDQDGEDRVAITGVVGEAPPERLKVCVNELGGWRNSVELVLTGLDVEAKAAWVREQLGPRLDRGRGRVVRRRRTRRSTPRPRRPPRPCCAAPSRTPRPTRSAAPSPPPPSSSRSAPTPASR